MADRKVISQNMATDTQGNAAIINQDNKGYIVNDGTDNRVLLGYQKDGFGTGIDYGLKVSQTGYDVLSTSSTNLSFNSAQNIFKIVTKGSGTIPSFSISGTPNASLITIPHGQSHVPVCFVYCRATLLNYATLSAITSDYVPAPIIQDTTNNANGYLFLAANGTSYPISISFIADSTNLYIQATYQGTASTTINAIPVVYYILQETNS